MENKDIISKIKELAYENVNKKLEEERKRTEDRINNELADVGKALAYVKNRLVFKKLESNRNKPYKYELVTEDIFFEDYNKETDYYKGINWANEVNGWGCVFIVNNIAYYDIRYLIKNYEMDINEWGRKLNYLYDTYRSIEEGLENIKRQEPAVKSIIEQLKKVEIEEND